MQIHVHALQNTLNHIEDINACFCFQIWLRSVDHDCLPEACSSLHIKKNYMYMITHNTCMLYIYVMQSWKIFLKILNDHHSCGCFVGTLEMCPLMTPCPLRGEGLWPPWSPWQPPWQQTAAVVEEKPTG